MSSLDARADLLAVRARRSAAAAKWAFVPAVMAVASPLAFGLFSLDNLGILVAVALGIVALAAFTTLMTLSRRWEDEVVRLRAFGDEASLSSDASPRS